MSVAHPNKCNWKTAGNLFGHLRVSAPVDLMAVLKQSLAQMEGKKKGPQRAELAQRGSEVEVQKKAGAPPKKSKKRPHNFVIAAIYGWEQCVLS
jgi:hypothetical protein